MSYDDLIQLPIWEHFSKKMRMKIERPRNVGYFSEAREMHLVVGKEGNTLALYWLVDPADGVIVDAKFQAFGGPALIAAADAACDLVVGKNYVQAKRISAELLDIQLRDKPHLPAFPDQALGFLNLVIDCVLSAADQCFEIPLSDQYTTPIPQEQTSEGYPGWIDLPQEKKLAVIEAVLDEEIRPYVELDSGGVVVEKLIDGKELVIAYQGACTSCFSAIGTTLSTIEQILQTKVFPEITVIPNMDQLHLS